MNFLKKTPKLKVMKIFVSFIFCILPFAMTSESLSGDVSKITKRDVLAIRSQLKQLNRNLPQRVDRITMGLRSYYDLENNDIVNVYQFDAEVSTRSEVFLSDFKKSLHRGVLRDKCQGVAGYFPYGTDVLFKYIFKNGEVFTTVRVNKRECSSR